MSISSKTMEALLRYVGGKYFSIEKIWLDEVGTQFYTLEFEDEYNIYVCIEYDHNDKDLYSKVVEV